MAIRLGATPVPIPNTMVKPQAADGTALVTVWESRWLPNPFKEDKRKLFYIDLLVLPVIRSSKGFGFLMTDKTVTRKTRTWRTKFSRSWHYMPMHEKVLAHRQTSLSRTTLFQSLASLCTLKTIYKSKRY